MAFGQNRNSKFGGASTPSGKEWVPQVVSGNVEKNDRTNEDWFAIKLAWVMNQDRGILMNNFNKVAPNVFQVTPNLKEQNSLFIKIAVNELDNFKNNFLPQVIDVLRKTMHYKPSVLDSLGDSIADKIDSTPTSADIEKSRDSIGNNWMDMLNKMNDPETRKKMLMFQTTVAYEREYGSKLSRNNIQEILSQNPNATFVTNAVTWRDVFKHSINPGATPIIINKAENRTYTKQELDAAARVKGFSSYKDAMVKTGNSTQTKHLIQGTANKMRTTPPTFYKEKVYDVADTTPLDPMNDPWINAVGLANNIVGLLNEPAKKVEADILAAQGKQMPQAKSGANDTDYSNIKAEILKMCQEKKLNVYDRGNDAETIAEAVYTLAINEAPKYNILKPDNQRKFASAVVASICAVFNIPSSIASAYFSGHSTVSKEEALDIYDIYKTLSNRMSNSMLAEGIHGGVMSPDEFMGVLNSVGIQVMDEQPLDEEEEIIVDDYTPEQIQESFFNLFNKMEHLND